MGQPLTTPFQNHLAKCPVVNIYIYIYTKVTTSDFVTFLHNKYSDVIMQKVHLGDHKAVLLKWTQQVGITPERMVIESPGFLYVIATDFNSPLVQNVLQNISL